LTISIRFQKQEDDQHSDTSQQQDSFNSEDGTLQSEVQGNCVQTGEPIHLSRQHLRGEENLMQPDDLTYLSGQQSGGKNAEQNQPQNEIELRRNESRIRSPEIVSALTKQELKQAIIHLINIDKKFLDTLHAAYITSITA